MDLGRCIDSAFCGLAYSGLSLDVLKGRHTVTHQPEREPIQRKPMQGEPEQEEWRELARQASEEQDSEKLVALVRRVIEAYDAEKRRGAPPISA